jgi:3-isopropylmalate dehydrogenase
MKFTIAVLAGDGIGPEVIGQAIRLLEVISQKENVEFELREGLIGAVAIDHTGTALPDETLRLCRNSDAILMGAVGHPKYDNDPTAQVRPEQGLLKIRKELGLFANIRPITTYPVLNHISPLKEDRLKDVDFVVYRELTGGIYFGEKGRNEDGTKAYDHCDYTVSEIQRISRMAFNAALLRKKRLTLVDKANVLETSRLWRETVKVLSRDYPDVRLDYFFFRKNLQKFPPFIKEGIRIKSRMSVFSAYLLILLYRLNYSYVLKYLFNFFCYICYEKS